MSFDEASSFVQFSSFRYSLSSLVLTKILMGLFVNRNFTPYKINVNINIIVKRWNGMIICTRRESETAIVNCLLIDESNGFGFRFIFVFAVPLQKFQFIILFQSFWMKNEEWRQFCINLTKYVSLNKLVPFSIINSPSGYHWISR